MMSTLSRPMLFSFCASSLVFGRIQREGVDDREPLFARELREDRRQARAEHLAVQLVAEILVGPVGKNPAAAAPQRARGHARARAAGAFLVPRLLRRVLHFAAILLRARAAAPVGEIGRHDLVHQRFVVFPAERRIRSGHRGGRLALFVDELQFHVPAFFPAAYLPAALPAGFAPAFAARFAGETMRSPPREPGTAPRMRSS